MYREIFCDNKGQSDNKGQVDNKKRTRQRADSRGKDEGMKANGKFFNRIQSML